MAVDDREAPSDLRDSLGLAWAATAQLHGGTAADIVLNYCKHLNYQAVFNINSKCPTWGHGIGLSGDLVIGLLGQSPDYPIIRLPDSWISAPS
jgi:hypothetical protein